MNIEFETTIEIGNRDMQVIVKASAHIFQDLYGADADGNRGEMRSEIDDFDMKVFDLRGNDITTKLDKGYEDEIFAIEERATDKLFEAYEER